MTSTLDGGPIRLVKTAFVIYHHAEYEKALTFLDDFGLKVAESRSNEVFLKGYGTEPFVYICRKATDGQSAFGGAAYVVESRAELQRAETVDGATKIANLDAPGGGEMVTLTDPAGHKVHLVHGQEEKAEEPLGLKKLIVNYEDEKPRVGKFQRFEPGPAPVYRWGHYGVTYPPDVGYEKMYAWYTEVIGLAPSDFVHRDGKPITCFFHVDRNKEFSDHHSFFFKPVKPNQKADVAHAAFEIHDFDVQQLGHNYLESKGYKLCWGVGRVSGSSVAFRDVLTLLQHVLGSQVFDYWFDTSGFMVEHYADGDLVNRETPVATVQAGPQALSVWGPPVPEVF
jgi:hypothetical protein